MTRHAAPASLLLVILLAHAPVAEADDVPQLQSGAIELGLSLSMLSVSGTTQTAVSTRAGRFFAMGSGLVALEGEIGYAHVSSLDRLDLGAQLNWQPILADRPYHPYVGVAAGLRQEFIGSFQESRYPLGIDLGLRTLVTSAVLIRTELRLRRVLGDSAANFNEVALLVGVSLLLGN